MQAPASSRLIPLIGVVRGLRDGRRTLLVGYEARLPGALDRSSARRQDAHGSELAVPSWGPAVLWGAIAEFHRYIGGASQ